MLALLPLLAGEDESSRRNRRNRRKRGNRRSICKEGVVLVLVSV